MSEQPEDDTTRDFLTSLKPDELVDAVRMGLWIVQSCEQYGLELIYTDDELITFKRIKQHE